MKGECKMNLEYIIKLCTCINKINVYLLSQELIINRRANKRECLFSILSIIRS